ncbi:MAG: hypothetical protein ACREDF_03975 [Thermoplasmata archaeon]
MTDLAVLAIGFGVLPLVSILLLSFRERIARHREAAWGGLVGVLAFLGLSHAMAVVLETKSFLFGGTNEAATTLFLLVALGLGAATAWVVFEGPFIRTEPAKIVWAAAAFLALHSFGDGLVLGGGFTGGAIPVVRIDSLMISATVVHRFIEGAVVLVPAFAAAWRPRASILVLSLSLVSIPAAYVPSALTDSMGLVAGSTTTIALSAFLAAMETAFVLLLLVRGFLPIASVDRGTRWIAWTAIGFIGISLVHFLVE